MSSRARLPLFLTLAACRRGEMEIGPCCDELMPHVFMHAPANHVNGNRLPLCEDYPDEECVNVMQCRNGRWIRDTAPSGMAPVKTWDERVALLRAQCAAEVELCRLAEVPVFYVGRP